MKITKKKLKLLIEEVISELFLPDVMTPGFGDTYASEENIKLIEETELYDDLMSLLSNENLCVALVANAIHESDSYDTLPYLKVNANGDCGSYAKDRFGAIDTSEYPEIFRTPTLGKCCSFGLFQYNICTSRAVGTQLLQYYGSDRDSSDQEKIDLVMDYENQINFIVHKVKQKFNTTEIKSINKWVELIVYRIERPADKAGSTLKRQKIAQKLKKRLIG